jgi:hypothetical protein
VRSDGALDVLRRRPGWALATDRLASLWETHGLEAESRAARYGGVYAGARGSMLLDVVASRQRPYQTRVLRLVEKWNSEFDRRSLAHLAEHGLHHNDWGLKAAEAVTIEAVARNLAAFAVAHGLDEDAGCRLWAESVDQLQHAPKLDPVVGSISGIGPALFAYMRMRSGSVNALKPDLRVRRALNKLGYDVPGNDHAILIVATGAAAELGTTLLALDQLLWWSE